MVPESRTVWVPINSQIRQEVVFKVSISHLQLQDGLWQWSSWTQENKEDIFKIAQRNIRPYEFDDNVHIQVTWELDLDLTVIDRQVYSILDWLGDIGGLGEACFFLGGGLLLLTQKDQFDSMLVSALYRVKAKNTIDDRLKK